MRAPLYHCLAVIFLAAGASACGSGAITEDSSSQAGGTAGTAGTASGGGGDKCVIDGFARTLIEEIVAEQTRAGRDVAKNSGDKKRGFAVQIPASKLGYVGFSALITECPSDAPPVTRCQSTQNPPPTDKFWETRDACVRFSCEKGAQKIGIVDTYLTMKPEQDPTKKHKFTYETTNPTGTAIYDPNPLTTWRIDLTDLNAIKVSADLAVAVKVTPTEGSLFDFKHKGTVTATRAADVVDSVNLDIEFTGLFLVGDPPITAKAALDAAGNASGEVKSGDEVLANITKTFGFEWQGDCAPAP
jgi:hypothetical protein